MAMGSTKVTMLAHQPGVETSKAVVTEVCSSSTSGTAARAVLLRREVVDAGRPPNTKEGAQNVAKANATSRLGSSTSLEAMGTMGPLSEALQKCCLAWARVSQNLLVKMVKGQTQRNAYSQHAAST